MDHIYVNPAIISLVGEGEDMNKKLKKSRMKCFKEQIHIDI